MQLGERFLIHQWTDGCAVFDQASGNTHTLDAATCAGFLAARNNESINAAIEGVLRAQWPDKEHGEIIGLVHVCVERLGACGLMPIGKMN
ncbi:MAG TPA: hypothetical protein VF096_04505 [Azonexus sp.]